MAERIKITYATLRNDNEELHGLYEAGLARAQTRLGAYHQNLLNGAGRDGLVFLNLPTSDPGVSGALWADAGVVTVSA